MPKKRGNGEGTTPYKRKNGLWCTQYTVHTPEGRKRKTLYGKPGKRWPQNWLKQFRTERVDSSSTPVASQSGIGWIDGSKIA